MRKSDSDHATPTLFAMPVLCSVEPTQAFARKGAVIVRAEVSGNVGMLVVSRYLRNRSLSAPAYWEQALLLMLEGVREGCFTPNDII